jgi:localization factor PodJL
VGEYDAGMTSDVPWQVIGVSSRTRQVARDAAQSDISLGDADEVLASDSRIGGAKLSVIPDPGGRSDLIAAARRAAQAGNGDVATAQDTSAQAAVLVAAGGIARLHVLIGATAAVLIALGLLQIARIMVSPSAETALVTPSNVGPDLVPSTVPELASGGDPALAASAADPLHLGSAPDLDVTGKVPFSNGTVAATAASAASVRPVPSAVGTNLDLAMPRPAQ